MCTLLALALALLLAAPATADTWCIPHVFDTADLNQSGFTRDHNLDLYMPGDLGGLGGCVNGLGNKLGAFIFDKDTGLPPSEAGAEVCPQGCEINLDPDGRRVRVRIEDFFVQAGVTMLPDRYAAYLVPLTSDAANANVLGSVVQYNGSPLNISPFGSIPERLKAEVARSARPRTKLFTNQFPIDSLDPGSDPGGSDTILHAAYVGGMPGTGSDLAVFVLDITFHDPVTMQPLDDGSGVPICNPCTFTMGAQGTPRAISLNIDEMVFPPARRAGGAANTQEVLVVVEASGGTDYGSIQFECRYRDANNGLHHTLLQPEELICPNPTSAPPQLGGVGELRMAPNPLNPSGTVYFDLEQALAAARLTLHDAAGRRVRTLHTGALAAGAHAIAWDGRDDRGQPVSSGSYVLQLDSPDGRARGKAVLLK